MSIVTAFVIALVRSHSPDHGHWASTDAAPAGFNEEQRYFIGTEGPRALYACQVGEHALVTLDPGCEGQAPLGLLGYLDEAPSEGTVALYRCSVANGADHFFSPDANCEGMTVENGGQPLGWASTTSRTRDEAEVVEASGTASGVVDTSGIWWIEELPVVLPGPVLGVASFRTLSGHYLQAELGGGAALVASGIEAGAWERFTLVDLRDGTIGILASSNQWVCAEQGGGSDVNANREAVGGWEHWRLIDLGGDRVALQASNGNYVAAEEGGGGVVHANREAIAGWETFNIERR